MAIAREVAMHILTKIEEEELYSNIILNTELDKSDLNELDKMLATQLVYGVVSYKLTLDYFIKKTSKIRLKKIDLPILTILRMGIYQLLFLDKIPSSAACNEAVKLAKKYGHTASANFVNAILRNISRMNKEEVFNSIEDKEERLSVEFSYPLWIIKRLSTEFGFDEMEKILQKNSESFLSTVRVNTVKITREGMINHFNDMGIKAEEGQIPDVLYINQPKTALHSKEFKNGFFTFQDEAPALVAHLLKAEEGQKILDICAAPGGKTTHVAELTRDKAEITAVDLHEHRGELIKQTAKRLGIKSITIRTADATKFIPGFENYFDRIIADVPCSGLGVIRKKPDIKFRVTEEEIDEINMIQKQILENASKYLKVGGRLIYSTCTILRQENQDTIKSFLEEHKDFCINTDESKIPENWKSGLENGMLLLLPDKHDCDGFFICSLMKKE